MNKNEKNQSCATRAEVYAAIDSERAYQDSTWPEGDPRPLSTGEGILLIEHYHARALTELKALDPIRKIAGIAVLCLENHGGSTRDTHRSLSREEVYALIDQDCEALVAPNEKPPIAWELANMRHVLLQARSAWASERRPELGALYRIREIAALAVRCLENHGAPMRA